MSGPQATAKDTRAALKRHVLPVLRGTGFTDGTPSRLWRRSGERIEIVELSCVSAYRARTSETTTASFEVRIGISLPDYGALCDPFYRDHVRQGPNGPRPSEPQMPIRGMICPAASPPRQKRAWGWEITSTWVVRTADEAERHAFDLARQFEDYALDWLSRDWDYREILALLRKDETSPFLIASGNGSYLRLAAEVKGSPIRAAHVAMVETALSGKT